MKLDYTWDDIEARRDKICRRTSERSLRTRAQTLRFVERVGYCLLFGSDRSDMPSILNAVAGTRGALSRGGPPRERYHSYVAELREVLPKGSDVFYGKVLQGRPSVVSLELLPSFLALAHRVGGKDEYLNEFSRGRLTLLAKQIMDILAETHPIDTKGLRLAVLGRSRSNAAPFEKAMSELQAKMLVVNVADEYDPVSFQWAPLHRKFGKQVRKARTMNAEIAREQILGKFFSFQVVSSVRDVQRALGWKKQVIFRSIGRLIQGGVIVASAKVEGRDSHYYAITGQGLPG
jgi:hypothetical protein